MSTGPFPAQNLRTRSAADQTYHRNTPPTVYCSDGSPNNRLLRPFWLQKLPRHSWSARYIAVPPYSGAAAT